jgi:hypothetical protein
MIRLVLAVVCLITFSAGIAQQAENIIIITTDGYRWQEVV